MDISTAQAVITKLEALAADKAATPAEADSAKRKAQELREKFGIFGDIPTYQKVEAPPTTVHEWVARSWSGESVARAMADSMTEFVRRWVKPQWSHLQHEVFLDAVSRVIARQSRQEPLDGERVFTAAWEETLKIGNADAIANGQAFYNENGKFVLLSMLTPAERTAEYERLHKLKVDFEKRHRKPKDEVMHALRVLELVTR
jgi:hypothetical protein